MITHCNVEQLNESNGNWDRIKVFNNDTLVRLQTKPSLADRFWFYIGNGYSIYNFVKRYPKFSDCQMRAKTREYIVKDFIENQIGLRIVVFEDNEKTVVWQDGEWKT